MIDSQQINRKDEHLLHALNQYQATSHPDFTQTRFVHHSFSNVPFEEVSLETKILSLKLTTPFFINAMTGGSLKTKVINQRLAILARETGIALASGSMSIATKDSTTIDSFKILRQEAPNNIIFANLGAHHTLENAKQVVDMIEADALQIHINTAQELVMPEGDRNFSNWLKNIEQIVTHLEVPVIVKEVGFGMSRETIKQLQTIGVQIIDLAGNGGTNFITIENARRNTISYQDLENWGQSALISLAEANSIPKQNRPEIIASGGIKTPFDMVKCLAMGANAVGLSGSILQLIHKEDSLPTAIRIIKEWQEQLQTILCLLNCRNSKDLTKTDLLLAPNIQNWCEARHIDWKYYANRSQIH